MSFLMNAAAFFGVVGVLIVLHEAGHFLVARACGAKAPVFSVGFGRRIWGFERWGTDFRLSLFPLGGYVRIEGLGPDESEMVGAAQAEPVLIDRWKRALILLAGPVANVIFAVIFVAMAFMLGMEEPIYLDQAAQIARIEADAPASAAGLQAGDTIVELAGESVSSWRALEIELLTSGGREVPVVIERGGQRLEKIVMVEARGRNDHGWIGILPELPVLIGEVVNGGPAAAAGVESGDRVVAIDGQAVDYLGFATAIAEAPNEMLQLQIDRSGELLDLNIEPTIQDDGSKLIGVGYSLLMGSRPAGFKEAFVEGARECWQVTVDTMRILGRLFTRRASMNQTMSGPLGIAKVTGDAARQGPRRLIYLMGIISLQLGIFNLLPIPVLDGGHLAFLSIEMLVRRDLPMRLKESALYFGFFALITLMVVVTFIDVVRFLPQPIYDFFQGS